VPEFPESRGSEFPELTVTTEEGKELARLCRTERLYDIEKWTAAGKLLDIPVDRNKSLIIAVGLRQTKLPHCSFPLNESLSRAWRTSEIPYRALFPK
jgi:hypothetical protein